jgi:hypothetical protein
VSEGQRPSQQVLRLSTTARQKSRFRHHTFLS